MEIWDDLANQNCQERENSPYATTCLLPEGPQLQLYLDMIIRRFFWYQLCLHVTPVLHVGWATCRRFTNIQVQCRASLVAQGPVFEPPKELATLTLGGAAFVPTNLRKP